MAFTHLHVHTEYSLLDGSCKIKELVRAAKEQGADSLAITDHGVMYGVIDFYKAAKEAGINPIIGCEVYVAPGSRFDREPGSSDDRYHHLVLLAENNLGYQNLMKLVSLGFVDGYYYRPRIDKEILEQYHEGLIALSACLAGELPRMIMRGNYEAAKEQALYYQNLFGLEHYYLELQDHGIPEQKQVNAALLRMSQETGIPLVATNDVHYIHADDAQAHDILLCIQTGKKVSDENRMRYEGGQYYLKTEEEMRRLFPYAGEALDNTADIAKRCHVEIEFGKSKLPRFDVPAGYTAYEYLEKMCLEGLAKRYPVTPELLERLHYELDVIRSMGFVDYFLIVWDFIRYAKEHDIAVGPGRGSAAGSLVAYSLQITDIDPLRYQLLFERFLNPERVTMPDIDIDFCFERRQEVIDYVVRKYGKDRVVQIVTFGTLAARGVIRDVGRALDVPYATCDTVAKMIPMELGITIDKALESNPDLKAVYHADEQIKYLIDMSRRLEGLPRHTSMHAAGVVISERAVDEYVPLSKASDGSVTTQYTMTTLEELGLLKMDFLGLRTLTVIQNAVNLIRKNRGITVDMQHLDYDDSQVYASISTGKNDGVFQLESTGMKSFMKELQPENLEDVIAGISLYRPGPMDFIPKYLKGKKNPGAITYECPQLEPILKPTHGCIVYQEQVMQIVRDLAGYSLGRSDLVRRAMAKKKADVMARERQIFVYGEINETDPEKSVDGCIRRGISAEVANQIFDEMTDFAKYAFNKSHAAAYAVVAYQTAYLKYYYREEFMAALMTSVIDNSSKVSEYMMVCRQMGIRILPPDINRGENSFTVSGGDIIYALSAIKSVGRGVVDSIVAERNANGTFSNLANFLERMIGKDINRRVVENLAKAGAFDSIPGTRREIVIGAGDMMEELAKKKKNQMEGQYTLFDILGVEERTEFEAKLPVLGEYPKEELLAYEKEVIGIYVSGHPLEEYVDLMKKNVTASSGDFVVDEETGEAVLQDGESVIVGGMVAGVTRKTTKNNKLMAFVTLEDIQGTVELIVFTKVFEQNRNILLEDRRIFVRGRVSIGDDPMGKLVVDEVCAFEDVPKELWIQMPSREDFYEKEQKLYEILHPFEGRDSVNIFISHPRARKTLPPNRSVSVVPELLEALFQEFGKENVKVVDKTLAMRNKII